MTVDMLAAAFIWPEEMLIGRTHIADDRDPEAADDPAPEPATDGEPVPFWAALVRRFRPDTDAPRIEAR